MSVPVTAVLGSISSHPFRGLLILPLCVVRAAIFPGWVIGVTQRPSCSRVLWVFQGCPVLAFFFLSPIYGAVWLFLWAVDHLDLAWGCSSPQVVFERDVSQRVLGVKLVIATAVPYLGFAVGLRWQLRYLTVCRGVVGVVQTG